MNSILGKFVSVWLHPWSSMEAVKLEGQEASIKPSIIFVVVMGVISGLITAIVGQFAPVSTFGTEQLPKAMMWLAVVIVPLVSVLGSFLGSLILWGIICGFLNGTASQYKTVYRLLALLAAFSPVSAIISSIPKFGPYAAIAINLWATIVMINGIIIILDTKPVRTWVTCGIVFGLLFLLGTAARVVTQNEFRQNAGLSDFGNEPLGGNAAIDEDDEALNKQLEALAEKAKAEPAAPASKK